MSLNFFRTDCQFPPINANKFGLCDNQNGTKAYPDSENPDTWVAVVKNNKKLPSGIYIVSFRNNNSIETKKLTVIH